jgi:acetyltransferase-like isoleucine patch superfamily enzyme
MRTRRYLRALIDPRFYSTLLAHVRRSLAGVFTDYLRNLDANDEQSEVETRLRLREDLYISDYKNLVVGEKVEIDRDVRIVFPDGAGNDRRTRITLGNHTYIGPRVSLGVLQGNRITIGDYTTINDNCVILGDVCLERYCTLSLNIFISSGNHYAKLFPSWLIKDQDAFVQAHPEHLSKHSNPVHIEEDCWLGWGVFVKQGVYIGRGAVIGAYSVVSRDVPPYSVQVGAPNKQIGTRIDFKPSKELQAANESHWPYFYAGFAMRQDDIAVSRPKDLLFAGERVRFMLAGGPFDILKIRGELSEQIQQLTLGVACNGVTIGEILLPAGKFQKELEVSAQIWKRKSPAIPSVLRDYNEIELQVLPGDDLEPALGGRYYYGVTSISIS